MSGWWLESEDEPGMYQNSKTGKLKEGSSFRLKNGFSASNMRSHVVRKEEVRQNLNGSTVKSYRSIDAGAFSRPTVAIKSLAQRSVGAIAANLRMLFTRSDGTFVWVSTGYTNFGSLSKVITEIISKYGWSLPTYLDIDILSM